MKKKLLTVILVHILIFASLPITAAQLSAIYVPYVPKEIATIDDEYIHGDINCDTEVNISDYFAVKSLLLGGESPSDEMAEKHSYDIDFNGLLGIGDLMNLKQVLLSDSDSTFCFVNYKTERSAFFNEFLPSLDENILINNTSAVTVKETFCDDENKTLILESIYPDGTTETETELWSEKTVHDKLKGDVIYLNHFLLINGATVGNDTRVVAEIDANKDGYDYMVVIWVKTNGTDLFITLNEETGEEGSNYRIYTYDEYYDKYGTSEGYFITSRGAHIYEGEFAEDKFYEGPYIVEDGAVVPFYAAFRELGKGVTISPDGKFIWLSFSSTDVFDGLTITADLINGGLYKNYYGSGTPVPFEIPWDGTDPQFYGVYNGDFYVSHEVIDYILRVYYGGSCVVNSVDNSVTLTYDPEWGWN